MLDRQISKQSLRYSGFVVLYVAAVATIMMNAPRIFGQSMSGVLAPIGFLMLFVVSAAVIGMLIFGKPVMLYVDGKKREAVALVVHVIGNLVAATVILLVVLALINSSTLVSR
jgi:hypothetical protein